MMASDDGPPDSLVYFIVFGVIFIVFIVALCVYWRKKTPSRQQWSLGSPIAEPPATSFVFDPWPENVTPEWDESPSRVPLRINYGAIREESEGTDITA